jgi:hypothetical protein
VSDLVERTNVVSDLVERTNVVSDLVERTNVVSCLSSRPLSWTGAATVGKDRACLG